MSMNGISNTLSLLSWIISALFIFIVLSIPSSLSILYNFLPFHSSPTRYGNPFLMFLIFIVHMTHSMAFSLYVSSYFTKILSLTFVLMIIKALEIALCIYIKQNYSLLAPYLGIVLPDILLYQQLQEFQFYDSMGIGIQWNNIFSNTNVEMKFQSSIGMAFILSSVGIIFHFFLTIYVNAIKPGKHSVGKDPLFFLKCNKDTKENVVQDNIDNDYFEAKCARINTLPGIQIRNLNKFYDISIFSKKKVHALRGISMDFCKGKITALLGHNGAGKTTFMSILTGMINPTNGLILIDSKNLNKHSSEVLKDVGLCAQKDMYFSSLTVAEQLEFFAMVKRRDKTKSFIRDYVETLLKKLKLSNVRDSLPNTLPEDQRRKLCLGIALAGNPSTLILDEPTSRLDHESRRTVWDILLEMKGKKTILISTHDMEEAEILGDKIAIMKNGRLKSYGTSLFLKKLLAGGNNIEMTLSIERWSYSERIRTELHNEAIITSQQDGKIIVSIPYTSDLSVTLRNLNEKKKELGVTGYGLSLATLEQVFLKVTEEDTKPAKPYEVITSSEEKLKGNALLLQSIKALFFKKLNFTLKNFTMPLSQILTVFLGFIVIFSSTNIEKMQDEDETPLTLGLYDHPYTLYTTSDSVLKEYYKYNCRTFGGNPIEVTDTNLDSELLRWAKNDLIHYNNYVIAGAEFNQTGHHLMANAFYSEWATYSLPISINLLWNSIIQKELGIDYSISLSEQILRNRSKKMFDVTKPDTNNMVTISTTVTFYLLIATFAVHPSGEMTKGIKNLQKITGLSGFIYWATIFLFDLMHYVLLVVIFLIGLQSTFYLNGNRLFDVMEIAMTMLLLILFGLSALPLIYIVTFANIRANNMVKIFTFIPITIVIVISTIISTQYESIHDAYTNFDELSIIHNVLLKFTALLPHISVFHGLCIICYVTEVKEKCRQLFYDVCIAKPLRYYYCGQKCKKANVDALSLISEYNQLTMSIVNLCVIPIIYFGILAILETQLLQKMKIRFVKQSWKRINEYIGNLGDNASNLHFLAHKLGKRYDKVQAVEDVSFQVDKSECFGLLGVNCSGKSTILKMMTGEVIPDHGTMYIGDKSLEDYDKHFLPLIGYCSQRDNTLECFNSYDHLRLFARLRGIPNHKIELEVKTWIERLNLTACASFPSSIYSNGNRQKLNIAIALIGNPKLLLLDEPTIGVDPGARRTFWNTIKSCQMSGQTVVLASHDMDECEAVCNRIGVISDGKLICIGTPEETKQRFGVGYDVQIRIDPKNAKSQLDKIKKDMRLLLQCSLTNENSGHLMYHVSSIGTTWTKIYDVMNRLKQKYQCIDDFLVVVRLNI